jgi:large repetitive protein
LIPSFSCTISTLAPATTNSTCTAPYTVTQADVNAGSIPNTATATAPGTPNATSTITTPGPARAPAFTFVKAGPASYTAAGQNVVYTFTVRNTGNVTLSNLTITDPLVPSLNCVIATLLPGATNTACTATYVATQANLDAGQIVNTASIAGTAPGNTPVSGTASDTTPGPARVPSMNVTKTETDASGGFGAVGGTEGYTFTVQNTGNVTLTNLSINDPLTGFNCAIANLAPGATATACANATPLSSSLTITQAIFDAGSLSNTVSVSGQGPGGVAVNDTATLTLGGPARTPAVSMAKSPVGTPVITAPGQTISYNYVVTNSGNITLTSPITVADDKIASVVCPNLPVAGLAPGGSVTCTGTYSVTQADIDTGSVTNNAIASITQAVSGQPVTATSTDSATVNVTQAPAVALQKSITAGTPSAYSAAGDTISFTFVVDNTGNTTLTGPIQVNDTLIQPPFTCVAGPLAPGGSQSCQATYTITQADVDAGSVTNTARAFTGPVGSPTLQSGPDSATAFAQQNPGLGIAKSTAQTAPTDFTLGNTINYAYVLTNTGNVTIPAPISVNDNGALINCGGPLALGAALSCTGSHVVTVNDLALGSHTNNATGVATFNGNPVPSTTATVTIPGGAAPALTIAKSETTGVPMTTVGQILNYSYTVTNTGNAAFASDVTVFDNKIAGGILCHDSLGGTIPLSPASTGPAPTSATCTANYTVTQADLDAGFVTNSAYAQSIYAPLSASPQTVQSPATGVTVNAATNPGLTVNKAVTNGPNPAAAGDVLTYAVTTTNTGNQTISVVTVTDPKVPAITTACTVNGSAAPANIVLVPADVLICTGTYTVTQADINAQTLGNTATVTGVTPQGNPISVPASNTYPVSPAAPALTVTKTILSPSAPPAFTGVGDPITYRVTVANTGNVTLSSTTVTDPLVPSATCAVGPIVPGGSDSTCRFTYVATQADVDRGSITNTATAVAQPTNTGAPTITGSGSVTGQGPASAPGFLIAKSADVQTISVTGPVNYTYIVTNTSNVTIRGVPSVTDNKIGTFACGTAPIAPGASTQCTQTYTVTQADLNAGGVTNIATAQAAAVPAGGGFPASPAVPPSSPVSLTLAVINTPSLNMTKSVISEVELFPTVWQATFQIDVTNNGNLTLTGLDIQDDLTAFAAPATLLSAQYPVTIQISGFPSAAGNPGYDGVANVSLLAAGAAMNPGDTGQVLITVTYSTVNGYPGGANTVVGTSPILTAPATATAVTTTVDSDGDGIVDGVESCTADRDGDGICDAQDYDPTGYFYCEDDGAILLGGSITVTGPAGSQSGIGTSNNITILRDGSNGAYQFFVTAPGTYTLTPTYPTGVGAPSTARPPSAGPLVVSTFTTNPAVLGSTEFGVSGKLADFTAAANTPSYLGFTIAAGDPHIIGNNFALTGCSGTAPITATKTANKGSARAGESVTFTLTFTNGTSAAGNSSTLVDQLPAGMVYTTGSATVNGVPTEPVIAGNRLTWAPYNLTPGLTFSVTLSARILGSAAFGTMVNQSWVETAGGTVQSNIATASVRVEPEHVFDCSDVIGKVFDDKNMNGYQDEGEDGIPDARVVTIRGVRITTDEFGRYHVPCAELPAGIGSNFTLKLDVRTLPSGYRVTTENPRMIRLTAGKMAKLNFGAAISRVVDLNVTASAFETGTNDPKEALIAGVRDLAEKMGNAPSVIRLSYIRHSELRRAVEARLNAVENLLREAWRKNGRYKLNVERTIKQVQ